MSSFHIGDRIRMIRHERRLTLVALSERARLHPSQLSEIERGLCDCTIKTIDRIAQALHVPMMALFLTPDDDELSGVVEDLRIAYDGDFARMAFVVSSC